MRIPLHVASSITMLACLAYVGNSNAQAAADGAIVVLVKSFPTPGREDELQVRYFKLLEFFRKTEPSSKFRLHRATKDPVVFLWYEVYESQAALENHLTVVLPAFRKEVGPTPEGLVTRPSEMEIYRDISK